MTRRIDYYLSLASPWTYIGHATFHDIAARHGATIAYKPTAIRAVFDQTGGLPLPKRHPVRQRYRLVELQRWRERRGLSFSIHPAHWPFDSALADRVAIAIDLFSVSPEPFLRRAHAAVWEDERDLADEAVIADVLREAGHADADALLAAARGEAAVARHDANEADALAAGVFGAPSYVLDGEVFWGQDRLELLDAMLTSGRAAYRPI